MMMEHEFERGRYGGVSGMRFSKGYWGLKYVYVGRQHNETLWTLFEQEGRGSGKWECKERMNLFKVHCTNSKM
jgi:hypothetical protein